MKVLMGWSLKSLSGQQSRAIHNFLLCPTFKGLIELFIRGKNKAPQIIQNLVRKVYKHLFVVWFNVPLMGGLQNDAELPFVDSIMWHINWKKFLLVLGIYRDYLIP